MVRSFVGQKLASGEGKLQGHLPKEYLAQTLTAVEILQCLYVNNGTFIFASRVNMTQGLALIYRHFSRLGLEMLIGGGENPSKTECVFFPSPGFFDLHIPTLPAHESNNKINNALEYGKDALTNNERRAEGKEQSRCKKEEELYDALDETQPIAVENGFVIFFLSFQVPWLLHLLQLLQQLRCQKMCHHCHPINGSSKECLELPPP